MGGRTNVEASEEQRRDLEQLSRSRDRAEADRARGILCTLHGETAEQIGQTLKVRPDQVRRWRMIYRAGGVDALRTKARHGPPARLAEAVLPVIRQILSEPVPLGVVWTVPRLRDEVFARTGQQISASWLRAVMVKKGGFAGVGRVTRSRTGKRWMRSDGLDFD
jgi:transposase